MSASTLTWNSEAGAGDGGAQGGAGGGAGDGGAGGAGAGGAAKPYYETFANETVRNSPSVQRFATAEALAEGFVNLEKRFGIDPNRRLDLPENMDDPEAMRAVYGRLGLPDKADGYGFKLDDKASDADKAMLKDFTEAAHKLGMPANFAKGAMAFWQDKIAAANEAQATADAQRITEGKAAVTKEWGAASETRDKEVRGLIAKYMGEDFAKGLEGDGLYRYPNLAKGLAKIVEAMAEPGADGGDPGDRGGSQGDMTPAQAGAALVTLSSDPIKSKALMDPHHPSHKAVVAERSRLLALRDGRKPEA